MEMPESLIYYIPLAAPVLLLSYALLAFGNGKKLPRPEFIGLVGILIACISVLFVYLYGTSTIELVSWKGLGFSIRLDALSVAMLTMIAILGFVILRFSTNYLDGDPRRHVFFGRLATTIASVELLVISGNLFQIFVFWVVTSVCLHYLLVFYRHRPQAIAAARKKFVLGRLGDMTLLGAVALIYVAVGTGDLQTIFDRVSAGGISTSMTWAAILLAVTAILKSAQFPTHGWLIEVVETPTPVSALLHAGLLNAGPFLMVRMSPFMIESTSASVLLMVVGGFTALFASVVYMTQPSVKVSLGYSSIAHMGFSLMICGLGVYSAAMLHIVAHSFYKGHAFLSSGSVIDAVKAQKISVPKRLGSTFRIVLSLMASLGIFLVGSTLWGVNITEEFGLMFIGSIIVMGSGQLLVQVLDSRGNWLVTLQTLALAAVVTFSFLFFENASRTILRAEIPTLDAPSSLVFTTAIILLATFVSVVFLQLISPKLGKTRLGDQLGIHLRNGLYTNVLFDRMIGSLKHEKFKWANLTVKEEEQEKTEISSEGRVFVKESGVK